MRLTHPLRALVLVALGLAISCAASKRSDDAPAPSPTDAGSDAAPFVPGFGRDPDAARPPPVESCTLASARPVRADAPSYAQAPLWILSECSLMGSPSTEPQRDPASEPQAPHHRLSDFEIDRTEVTRAAWKAAGFLVPDEADAAQSSGCGDDACPVDAVTWQEALAFANARSASANLTPCFDLSACSGTVGRDFSCTSTPLAQGSDVYACKGYRLPTAYEWEIAARGSSLDWKITPPPPSPDAGCWDITSLDSIAWYCNNADGGLHPVATLDAAVINAQRIWDMIGNAAELVFDVPHPLGYAAELYDPGGAASPSAPMRVVKGGSFDDPAAYLRPASLQRTQSWSARVSGVSFRLAMTHQRGTADP